MPDNISCIIVDDEAIAREVLETHINKIDGIELKASCKNALEAFKVISNESIDLVFLDINMPEISGLSFAKSLSQDLKIIFTTAYREYAVDGFDLQAVDYLLKPISFERLLQSISKYLKENLPDDKIPEQHIEYDNNKSFFVRSDRKMVKVNMDDILYIESLGDYIKIHMNTNNCIVTRETLANIEARLSQRNFLKIHRSFITSMAAIDSFTNEYIEIGKIQLPISRSFRNSVLLRLENSNNNN